MNANDYIDVYNKNKTSIDKHKKKYYMYVKSNPYLFEQFKTITRNNRLLIQTGGLSTGAIAGISVGVIGASSSCLLLTIIISGALYWLYSGAGCKPDYPLVSHEKQIEFIDLLNLIIPINKIPESELSNEKQTINNSEIKNVMKDVFGSLDNVDTRVYQIMNVVDGLNKMISVIDPESKLGKTAIKTLQTALGALGTVITVGLPADMLVNLVFAIKSAIALVIKFLGVFSLAITIMKQLCPEEKEVFIYYVYDILNINFEDGPLGVKCQYDYIKKKYAPLTPKLNFLLCKLFSVVYLKFASFFGDAISMMIPYNFGLISHAIYVLLTTEKGKSMAMGSIIKRVIGYYNKIPTQMKKIIQSKTGFEDLIKCIYNPYMFKIIHDNFDKAIDKSVEKFLNQSMMGIPTGLIPSSASMKVYKFGRKITNFASKTVTGHTPKDLLLIPIFSMFGVSLEDLSHIQQPPECIQFFGKQKNKNQNKNISEPTQETNATLQDDDKQIYKMFVKFSGLFGFFIHKLMALSFLLLYTTQECPIGDKLDKQYNNIISSCANTQNEIINEEQPINETVNEEVQQDNNIVNEEVQQDNNIVNEEVQQDNNIVNEKPNETVNEEVQQDEAVAVLDGGVLEKIPRYE